MPPRRCPRRVKSIWRVIARSKVKKLKHILFATALGTVTVIVSTVQFRGLVYASRDYNTLKAQLRCGNVLTVETSMQKRTLGDDLVFCGICDGRPYLLIGPSTDDLRAFPIGDGGKPKFVAQDGNRFTLDCTDRIKTVTVEAGGCRVEDRAP